MPSRTSRTSRLLWSGIAFALVFAACEDRKGGGTVTVAMTEQGGSGQSGSVVLNGKGAKTEIVLVSAGPRARGSQPAYIHPGTCGSDAPVLFTLNKLEQGRSTTTVDARLAALTGAKNSISVHSAEDGGRIESCGNIP